MHILVAPNSFKNSLPADKAADAIREGFLASALRCTVTGFPIGDGGDGTGELILMHLGGRHIASHVHDPFGRTVVSKFGLVREARIAVIEMAQASGLQLLKESELNPVIASSYGTGQLVLHALNEGAETIILCIGGSATVDGGAGILRALGFRFLTSAGEELTALPADLDLLDRVDDSAVDPRIFNVDIIVLCDVGNPLCGEEGAAAVFGPQKGATPQMVKDLDDRLRQLAVVARRQTGLDLHGIKGGGAAGGTAAGLHAFVKAKLVDGIDYFLDFTGFDKQLEVCDLVVTGEGSIDSQTLNGKGPFGVAARAKARKIPVIGIAGRLPLEIPPGLRQYFDSLFVIGNEPTAIENAMRTTAVNLTRISREIGNLLAMRQQGM